MTETFDHLFGGWKRAKARRWKNADGTDGGIVAVDARLHPDPLSPSGNGWFLPTVAVTRP